MVRALILRVATAALLVGCSERRVEEERESHRHLAAEYCKDWCTFWTACEPTLADWPVSDCRESCEGDEAWDWTDECGDIMWEYLDCRASLTCEDARNDPEIPGTDDPCGHYYEDLVVKDCWNDRRHGR